MPTRTAIESLYRVDQLPPEVQLQEAIRALGKIENAEERELAEVCFLLGSRSNNLSSNKHIIVLIHGIRTHAPWQERLADAITTVSDSEVYPIGYGFFDVIRFWFPFFTRKAPINKVARELRFLQSNNPGAKISLVAHSFGTYIVSKILEDETDIKLHRIQLCGSIISIKYRWDKVVSRITGALVNDVGTKDGWPIFAKSVSWGYGSSGTFGFKTAAVKDRYFNFAHSDFFSDSHINDYWLPLIIDGQCKPSPWSSLRPSPSIFRSICDIFPFKSSIAMVAAYLIYNYLY